MCGATNSQYKESLSGPPKTIEELKIWYKERNLPDEEITRFFIGKDVKEPRAFGIYQDGDMFIVYKNKADGSSAIRYKGNDESYAVNEIYLKLKEEILNQKAHNKNGENTAKTNMSDKIFNGLGICFLIYMLVTVILTIFKVVTAILMILFKKFGYLILSIALLVFLYKKLGPKFKKMNTKYKVLSILSVIFVAFCIFIVNPRNNTHYVYNDNLYYHLVDRYNGDYKHLSGWYIYNDTDDDWDYYCSNFSYPSMGMDFIINKDIYSFDDSLSIDWDSSISFESTEVYSNYLSNKWDYEESHTIDWDDYDIDFDWDSSGGDSWDSSYTDWDSDW